MTLGLESPLGSIPLHGLAVAALGDAVAEQYRAAANEAFDTLSVFDINPLTAAASRRSAPTLHACGLSST